MCVCVGGGGVFSNGPTPRDRAWSGRSAAGGGLGPAQISPHPPNFPTAVLTGPLEKKTPSGFILSTSAAGKSAGTTVMRQP